MSTPKYEERGCPFDEPLPPTVAQLGQDFTEANDKPPERPPFNWLKLELKCVEVAVWLLCAGFVAFCLYVGTHLRP